MPWAKNVKKGTLRSEKQDSTLGLHFSKTKQTENIGKKRKQKQEHSQCQDYRHKPKIEDSRLDVVVDYFCQLTFRKESLAPYQKENLLDVIESYGLDSVKKLIEFAVQNWDDLRLYDARLLSYPNMLDLTAKWRLTRWFDLALKPDEFRKAIQAKKSQLDINPSFKIQGVKKK